ARLPCRSITFVFSPTHLRISTVVPIAAMRLPRIATASTSGCLSFTVQIFPLIRTRSAGAFARSGAGKGNTEKKINNCFIERVIRFQGNISAVEEILPSTQTFRHLQRVADSLDNFQFDLCPIW